MTAISISGAIVELPDGALARTYEDILRCSPPPSERLITLASDAPFMVALDGMTAVNMLYIEADSPVVATLNGGVLPSSDRIQIVARATAITSIVLTRAVGQATTVRMILAQGA